ncbi:MAG: hypothetical protein QOH29_2976 [Actinomycetota bacterium]|jgi:uncharacterized protein with FMN-binding domain|nr:hypothetical protein [Actinomycetota bacterium]
MRRFVAVFVATVAGLVILLSFKTTTTKSGPPVALSGTTPGSPDPASSPPASVAPQSTPAGDDPQSAAPSSSAAPSPSTSSAKPAPSTSASGTKTVTGTAVTASEGGRRQFGVVTVQLTVTNGKITKATVTSWPQNDQHSAQISSFAIPVLNSEVVAAQSAQINAVSGATITSNAYAQSLQAALDKLKA